MESVGLVPSAVRFGLLDLQPFEETIEERIGNIKFVIKQLSLRPSESFRDYSTLSSHAAIEQIRDLPPGFAKDKLREHLTKYLQSGIERDPELAKLVKQVEQGNTLGSGRSHLHTLLNSFVKRYEANLSKTIGAEMVRFLHSDLPFALFDEFSLFHRTYAKFLPTINESASRMQTRVLGSHKSRGYRGAFLPLHEFKRKIATLLMCCDLAWVSYFAINLYLDVKHSETIEDVFTPKAITFAKLDKHEFERLLQDLRVNNDKFRDALATYGLRGVQPKEPKVSVPTYTVWHELNDFLVQA